MPSLDLTEHEGAPVGGHDVQLAPAGAEVAGDDLVTAGAEMFGGHLLAERAQAAAGVGGVVIWHVPEAKCRDCKKG
jgi:hypothetical protein